MECWSHLVYSSIWHATILGRYQKPSPLIYMLQFLSNILQLKMNIETEKGIFDAILKGEVDIKTSPWNTISERAKDLVLKMLTKDPKKRITAAQALG